MPSNESINLVTRLIAEICEIDQAKIQKNGKLMGFGIDSVRLLDLIMALEDELGVEISENDPELATVQTVEDMAALIERRRA
jgi:acyl carrier protein